MLVTMNEVVARYHLHQPIDPKLVGLSLLTPRVEIQYGRPLEVKYFSATPEGAASYARQAVRGFGDGPYTLVETQVPRSALPADVLLQVDRNVPAVVLPNTHLPLLGPANVWPFMPVP